jgi:hypothetical protein
LTPALVETAAPCPLKWMQVGIPPVSDTGQFEAQLAKVPARMREDALQEAWVAHLSGEDALRALWRYTQREKRIEKRHVPIEQNDGDPYAIDRDGTRLSLPAQQPQSKSSVGTRRRNSLAKAG